MPKSQISSLIHVWVNRGECTSPFSQLRKGFLYRPSSVLSQSLFPFKLIQILILPESAQGATSVIKSTHDDRGKGAKSENCRGRAIYRSKVRTRNQKAIGLPTSESHNRPGKEACQRVVVAVVLLPQVGRRQSCELECTSDCGYNDVSSRA